MTAPYTVQTQNLADYELAHVARAGAELYTKHSEHPIAVDLLVMLAGKEERIEVRRKGVKLGPFVSLQPASVKPFYTLTYIRGRGQYDTTGGYPDNEMMTARLVERLEIEKSYGVFVINIPE